MKKVEVEILDKKGTVVKPNLVDDDDSHVGDDSYLLEEEGLEEQQPHALMRD